MSRSVVNCVIAAGVLCAGAAVTGPAAAADPIRSGDTGVGATDAGGVSAGNSGGGDGVRRRRGPGAAHQGAGTVEWPCPWWPIPIPPFPNPVTPHNSLIGIDVAVPVVVQVPNVSVSAPQSIQFTPRFPDPGVFDVIAPAAQPAAPGAAASTAQPSAARPSSLRQYVPASPPRSPAASPPPPPAAVPPAPAAVPPAPPPLQRQDPAAGVRMGYPEELRTADVSRILATALPGLAAIAGMTALGGLLGYRQAKAGYMLRAAGAGRFLQ